MFVLKKLVKLLSRKEKKHLSFLLVMILIMSILDTIGVASILPFISIISNPSLVESNSLLNSIFISSKYFGLKSIDQFLFFFGISVFLFLIFTLIFKAIVHYWQLHFIEMREHSIGKLLIEGYLKQNYDWYLNKNSSHLGKNILSEVKEVIDNGLAPMMKLITQGLVVFFIILLLILIDLKLAINVGFTLSVIYVLIFSSVNSYLARIGKERFNANEIRFKTIADTFGAIKEIKFGNTENTYLNKFSKNAKIYSKHQSSAKILAIIPRFILEGIAFGGMMIIILYLMRKSGNFNNTISIISLYAFAGYRLLPAMQQIYEAITKLKYVKNALDILYKDLIKLNSKNFEKKKITKYEKVNFDKTFEFKEVYFKYPNSEKNTLKNISFKIDINSRVGFVGSTGSGKSTIIDIMLGLLTPQKGEISIDEKNLSRKNYKNWQLNLGYVPQQIYLLDDTILSNIAFSVESEKIDFTRVEKAARLANIDDFITRKLPHKYETVIGERGVRISGGERQRIGIARALYHNPKVLILDEATSALDNLTEQAVMESINELSDNLTIITVAHRLSTLKNYDKIFLLDNGEIIEYGNYEELMSLNKKFSKFAKVKKE
jgi:ABC-type multidrug transport system fused ATPase/permease subunit